MTRLRTYISGHISMLSWLLAGFIGLTALMVYRLGSLTHGLSAGEHAASIAAVGWHGVYAQPLYLPLKLIRSVVFFLFADHGRTLTRLPNVLFGVFAVVAFSRLIDTWHGRRTAVLAGLMFATSAWVLHVSRLASFDVLYLWAMSTLLLIYFQLPKHVKQAWAWYLCILAWGLMLYIPGMIWLVLVSLGLQRKTLLEGWRAFSGIWKKSVFVVAALAWLPLLLIDLTRPGQLKLWLGLPGHLAPPLALLKQLVGVPVHLFIRGPEYPALWLAKAPILDIFTLVACVLGMYFYVSHSYALRSRILGLFFIVGAVLIGLGGAVSLSLVIPILYVAVATGITFLLRDWLKVFPENPFARSLGIFLVCLVVALSCLYNLRAYFIAWPHNHATRITFRYHR